MTFVAPSINELRVAFPEALSLTEHRRGGFKAVYRAETLNGSEAFKLLCLPSVTPGASERDAQEAARREHLSRALREVELLGQVAVPETVKLASIRARIETINGVEYLGYSEEWLEGVNLLELIRATPRAIPLETECISLSLSLVKAIRAIWALDTVHRDIKPVNVMCLTSTDRPFVLLDLGIAYDVSEPGLTYNSAIIPATLRYLAPEMADVNFRERLDFRSDLYTAGLSIFEFATGRHPIARDSDDNVRTVTRALNQAAPPLKTLRPDFSDDFCAVVDQLLRKKPILRPGNLPLLLQRLESLLPPR